MSRSQTVAIGDRFALVGQLGKVYVVTNVRARPGEQPQATLDLEDGSEPVVVAVPVLTNPRMYQRLSEAPVETPKPSRPPARPMGVSFLSDPGLFQAAPVDPVDPPKPSGAHAAKPMSVSFLSDPGLFQAAPAVPVDPPKPMGVSFLSDPSLFQAAPAEPVAIPDTAEVSVPNAPAPQPEPEPEEEPEQEPAPPEDAAETIDASVPSGPSAPQPASVDAALTPEACKTARQILGWSLVKASTGTGADPENLYYYEHREGPLADDTLCRIREAFERAGIEFYDAGDGQQGARSRANDHGR